MGWIEFPSSEKNLHIKRAPVFFLDILLFEELEGTCVVCE